ncbi:ROK family protein [Streptomyces sp. NPDC007991]|uniref:ROK family protein n=1 Tax=Streptomyces sp. NPDC007991 TaxID=3364803 RepID=UPI0036E32730
MTKAVRGVVAEGLRGAVEETGRETGTEALRGMATESVRDARGVLRGVATEAVRAAGLEGLRARAAGPEAARAAGLEGVRAAGPESARETGLEGLRAAGPESAEETGLEGLRARAMGLEGVRAAGPEAVRATGLEGVRAAGLEGVRAAAEALTAGPVLGPAGSLLGVGVALPGPLDHVRGVLHRVTGFPEWDGFPLREALAERLGVPVVVDKDTNAAALGLAAGGEGGSFAYLHLGTGLGAGLVIGGSVHRGARTGAGEFGHQVIQLDGPPCTCGDRGCVEALCLGAAARGDVEEAARVLGAGAANLVGLLDIDVVLLGGRTVAAAPEAFVRGVGAVLGARARRTGEDVVPVRVAPGGGRAVAAGAAQLVLGPVFRRGVG